MEQIINRARIALSIGIPEEEIFISLQDQVSADEAYLAIKAAKILLNDSVEIK